MPTIVNLIDEVIENYENEEALEEIASKVNSFMQDRPLFQA